MRIHLAGTMDTKSTELSFLADAMETGGSEVRIVDLSTTSHHENCDVSASEIAAHHPKGVDHVLGGTDRGVAVRAMGEAFAEYCRINCKSISGVIGIGGGGGTAMITAGMRHLPYGVPKLMVSTLASGDTSAYVDTSDIIMMPSVTDIAGLNFLSRMILQNAASAMLGMMAQPPLSGVVEKPTVGMSMFGVTTPAVTEMVRQLDETGRTNYDAIVFHATGAGGRTMEKLLLEGHLAGLIDLTTTEIADHLCGGVLSSGPQRLDAVAVTAKPYVGAPGALDMVNFQAPDTIPEKFKGRQFYHHNANVTLMRTTPYECQLIGKWIADKLNACDGPVRFLIPEKGVSALDIEGGVFWNPESDQALFQTLEETLIPTPDRKLIKLPMHINDPEFARAAVQHFFEIAKA